VGYASGQIAKLCPTCVVRYEQNPLRMLDCKEPGCKAVLANGPRMVDYLCEECAGHFAKVQAYLRDMGVGFGVDPTLVRGFDYYTKTAFEFVSGQLGAQNAIGGGGRYDNLVEEIGGEPAPAIGFGLGMERLVLTLDALGVEPPGDQRDSVFVAGLGEAGHEAAVKVTFELRGNGIAADMDYTGRSLKAQMKIADKLGARWVVILGGDEIARGAATVRDMRTSRQQSVPLCELAARLASG
jgi:histidyl-tRNA synthetase